VRKSNNQATALALLGALCLLLGTLFSLGATVSIGANAARVERLEPASAAIVAARAPGRDVLVEGRISPATPLASPPLVAYVVERPGPDSSWQIAERITPPLLVDLDDGQVRVVGSYALDATSWSVPQPDARLRGFIPGDPVTVLGLVVAGDQPTIQAELVLGGTRESYIGASRSQRPFGPRALGFGLLILGALLLLPALLRRRWPA
jgi:hypothetical protein